jgi:dTDP-4-dehydrorhamnose reductase
MRILVTGSKGQLGRELIRVLAIDHDVSETDLPELDIRDAGAVARLVGEAQPEVVIHAAALTDTRRCEVEPDLAHQVNGLGSHNVALACREAGAALAYVSTNEVFDGQKGEPYVESDEPNPVNAYGRSKLAGEEEVRSLLDQCWIVRTAWLYGQGDNNFPMKILAAAERGELAVVTDEIATPTWARDLAAAIASLVGRPLYDVYHFTSSGECSRYEWAREALRLAGHEDASIRPTTMAEYQLFPPKPPYTVLRNEAGSGLGITLRPWREALGEYFAALREV